VNAVLDVVSTVAAYIGIGLWIAEARVVPIFRDGDGRARFEAAGFGPGELRCLERAAAVVGGPVQRLMAIGTALFWLPAGLLLLAVAARQRWAAR